MHKTTTLKKITIALAHIVAWICFLTFPWFLIPNSTGLPSFGSPFFKILISNYIFLIFFFYLNAYFLIPKLLFNKKWIIYFLIIIILFIFFINLPKLIIQIFDIEFPKPSGSFRKMHTARSSFKIPIITPSVLFLLVYTISTSIKLIQQWLLSERQKNEYEKEILTTELSFLKTQINPHFFFNTLNNIYSLAVSKSDNTAPTILKLSTIMRYVLSESKQEMVPLDEEINFIKDYIELQKVRLTDKVSVEFTTSGNTSSLKVPQLLFIPFIENAFKYGVSTIENSSINIVIEIDNKGIHFISTNTIVTQTNEHLSGKNGIGIKNSQRRLELLYKDAFTLDIQSNNKLYTVKLDLHNYDN